MATGTGILIGRAVFSAIAGSWIATAVTASSSLSALHVVLSYPAGGIVALLVFSLFSYEKQRLADRG